MFGNHGISKQTTLWNFGIHSSLLKFAGGLVGAWSEQRENFCAFDTLSSCERGIIFARLSPIVTGADVFLQDLDTFTL